MKTFEEWFNKNCEMMVGTNGDLWNKSVPVMLEIGNAYHESQQLIFNTKLLLIKESLKLYGDLYAMDILDTYLEKE